MERTTHSMTGVGFAAGPTELGELRIEVRTVNGRGFAAKLRLPPACSGFDAAIEELVRQHVLRGSVQVVVERAQVAPPLPDRELLRAVAAGLNELANELRLPPPVFADVLQVVNASSRGDAMTSRPLPPKLRSLFEQALVDLTRHRRTEGAGTAGMIAALLDEFALAVQQVALRAPELAVLYRERLLQRVNDFIAHHLPQSPPAVDVIREVALFADRIDVAEELQRLQAHLGELRAVLGRGGEVGRRLEFLLQELLRETNTLGSKSPDAAMAHTAVAMKTAIERMKEQAANLE